MILLMREKITNIYTKNEETPFFFCLAENHPNCIDTRKDYYKFYN